MDVTNCLAEIHDRMTARAFMAVHNPEQGPEVRRVLEELLTVLDRTSPDGDDLIPCQGDDQAGEGG